MRVICILFILLLVVIGVAFSALNSKSVMINYLIGTTDLPLVVLLLIALVLGAIITLLFMGFNLIRLRVKNRWLENKLHKAQEQLEKFQRNEVM